MIVEEFGNSVEPILEKLCEYESFDEATPLPPSTWGLLSPKPCRGSLPGLPHVAWASAHVAQFWGLAQVAAWGRSQGISPWGLGLLAHGVGSWPGGCRDGGLLWVLSCFRRGNAWGCLPFFWRHSHSHVPFLVIYRCSMLVCCFGMAIFFQREVNSSNTCEDRPTAQKALQHPWLVRHQPDAVPIAQAVTQLGVIQGTSDGEQAVCNPSCATWAYFHHLPSIHAFMHGWMHASILRLGSVRLDQIPLHYNTIYTFDCSTVPHHTILYHTILYHTRLRV